MKKIFLICLLLLGNVGMAEDNRTKLSKLLISNMNALELAMEVCLEEKIYWSKEMADSCGFVANEIASTHLNGRANHLKIFEKACDSHIDSYWGRACFEVADISQSRYLEQAKKYFKRTMEFLPEACDEEYRQAKHSETNILTKYVSSTYYYGNTCRLLGNIYANGWFDIQADKNKALMYYKRACEMEGKCEDYNRLEKELKK